MILHKIFILNQSILPIARMPKKITPIQSTASAEISLVNLNLECVGSLLREWSVFE